MRHRPRWTHQRPTSMRHRRPVTHHADPRSPSSDFGQSVLGETVSETAARLQWPIRTPTPARNGPDGPGNADGSDPRAACASAGKARTTAVRASPTGLHASPTRGEASPAGLHASPTRGEASSTGLHASPTSDDASSTGLGASPTRDEASSAGLHASPMTDEASHLAVHELPAVGNAAHGHREGHTNDRAGPLVRAPSVSGSTLRAAPETSRAPSGVYGRTGART